MLSAAVISLMWFMLGWLFLFIGHSDPIKILIAFDVPAVVFALFAIAVAIEEHGKKIQRGANPS